MALELRILGPVEAVADGIPVELGTAKERALLALLALNAGKVVSADRLADDLWEGEPPAQAPATLRVYVSHLRKALDAGTANGEIIKTRRPGYMLDLPAGALDASRFEDLCVRGRSAADDDDQRNAAALYREALALWRGSALADVADQAFARTEAARLEEARLAALEGRIAADLALGRHAELVGELDALTKELPLRERLWGHRMTALYRAGRQADALAAYRELRDRLAEELGIDPSPELQELERKILAQDASLAAQQAPQPVRLVLLPSYRTTFFGREDEIASISRDVAAHQLVTLTGVGGCGKTRLGIEAASRLGERFPDGVFFVDLGAVADPDGVPIAVATTLGLATNNITGRATQPLSAALTDHLQGRCVLVVLDNCEHLLEDVAGIAETVLDASTDVRLIATSREALGIEGERVVTVPSLGLPNESAPLEADSVRLFVDRARAARSVFRLEGDSVRAVAEICRRLDGIPLAIELAAARVTHLSPRQIADRLSDRFRLLTGGRRRTQRQQTLQAAIDWSYELLEPDERTVFRRLAVFPSDFPLESAEGVAGSGIDTLMVDVLGSLVSKSLLTIADDSTSVRYRLPETLRLYAEQRLVEAGESEAIRSQYLDYFRGFVEGLAQDVAAFNPFGTRLEKEYPSLMQAVSWADLTGDTVSLATLLARTRMHWLLGPWPEAVGFFERALAVADQLPRADRVILMMQYANLLFSRGERERSLEFGKRTIALAHDDDGYPVVEALFRAGQLSAETDRQTAEAYLDRALRIAEHLDYPTVASVKVMRAEASMAWSEFETALDLYRSVHDISPEYYMAHWGRFGEVFALHLMSDHAEALRTSDLAEASAATLLEVLNGTFLLLWTRIARVLALVGADRMNEARDVLGDVFTGPTQGWTWAGWPSGPDALLLGHAAVAYRAGDLERASILLARSRPGMTILSAAAVYRHYGRLIRDALGPERARRLKAEGEAMPLEEALRLADE